MGYARTPTGNAPLPLRIRRNLLGLRALRVFLCLRERERANDSHTYIIPPYPYPLPFSLSLSWGCISAFLCFYIYLLGEKTIDEIVMKVLKNKEKEEQIIKDFLS